MKLLAAAIVMFSVSSNARVAPPPSFPGAMCFNTAGCNDRCEVCVKATPYAPSGTCMKISGCF
jgi:hypothetical protein